jgi:isopenicillin-N N-acyltransferase-like protein
MLPPVVSVKGSPFECGQQYGSQAQKIIRKNVAVYFVMWRTLWGAERKGILEKSRALIPVIGDYDADMLEELEGLAKGAELSLEEIIAINARYEINFALGLPSLYHGGGCTSVSSLPQVTRDGHTLIGQNWDWLPRFQEFNVILKAEQTGKPAVVTQPEAGVLAHRGMNSAGIGACWNGLASSRDKFGTAVPLLLVLRRILNSESFSQALEAVFRAKPTMSGNFFLAHRDGEAIDVEVSPLDVGFVYPEGGILTHSNHFIALKNRENFTDILKSLYPDTLFRHQRARNLLEPEKGHIDVSSFQRVFQDHFSQPNSICRHLDERVDGIKQWVTLHSAIMDLTEPAMYVARGYPCQSEYEKVACSDFLKR